MYKITYSSLGITNVTCSINVSNLRLLKSNGVFSLYNKFIIIFIEKTNNCLEVSFNSYQTSDDNIRHEIFRKWVVKILTILRFLLLLRPHPLRLAIIIAMRVSIAATGNNLIEVTPNHFKKFAILLPGPLLSSTLSCRNCCNNRYLILKK